nr:hypothetical protein Iba_chr02aCG10450 [Ipomoea batatas]
MLCILPSSLVTRALPPVCRISNDLIALVLRMSYLLAMSTHRSTTACLISKALGALPFPNLSSKSTQMSLAVLAYLTLFLMSLSIAFFNQPFTIALQRIHCCKYGESGVGIGKTSDAFDVALPCWTISVSLPPSSDVFGVTSFALSSPRSDTMMKMAWLIEKQKGIIHVPITSLLRPKESPEKPVPLPTAEENARNTYQSPPFFVQKNRRRNQCHCRQQRRTRGTVREKRQPTSAVVLALSPRRGFNNVTKPSLPEKENVHGERRSKRQYTSVFFVRHQASAVSPSPHSAVSPSPQRRFSFWRPCPPPTESLSPSTTSDTKTRHHPTSTFIQLRLAVVAHGNQHPEGKRQGKRKLVVTSQ